MTILSGLRASKVLVSFQISNLYLNTPKGKIAMYNKLNSNYDFWKYDLKSPSFVLDIVGPGYRLPFKGLSPTKCNFRNNKSAMNNSNFVETAILKLLADGKIEERTDIPFCVNPQTVAEGKKKRLVLDLRHVNKFLYQPKFRYEDLNSLAHVFEQDYWFFNWDLKSRYHHVNIYKLFHNFFGFSWAINGRPRYFVFRVLPFGLSSACFCFTKLLRPFSTRWGSLGDRCFIFIDDGISGHQTRQLADFASARHKSDLARAGFIFSEKCH